MLVVTDAQKKLLDARMEIGFVERVDAYVEEELSDVPGMMDTTRRRITILNGIAMARTHGFETERDIVILVSARIQHGDGFENSDRLPFKEILAATELPPTVRASQVQFESERLQDQQVVMIRPFASQQHHPS